MATYPYLILGPTAILSIIGLLRGADKTIPTPVENWHDATVDVIIPTYNEQQNITLCLASLAKQTFQLRNITLIDDNSTDDTVFCATEFCKQLGLNLKIIRRTKNEGKTPSLAHGAYESDADVEFILDGDTILESENYIERLVEELYQGVGIASACGVILPLREIDYHVILERIPLLKSFQQQYTQAKFIFPTKFGQRLGQGTVHLYRDMLYQFLQRFIYYGEMVSFGSIINPVGCAVAYRRKYLAALLTTHARTLGLDLTTSEDIFIGFNFLVQGYRNIQVQNVSARTREPPLSRLPHQIFLWSSAFLQSCYYFGGVVNTPFKALSLWLKHRREKKDPAYQEMLERRKIKEAYRQSFGEQYTQKYGRPMGWYIFSSLVEKICFPIILLLLIIFQLWEPLLITFLAELLLFSFIATLIAEPGKRLNNFGKSILVSPMRYLLLLFDLYIIATFLFDIWLRKGKKWRK